MSQKLLKRIEELVEEEFESCWGSEKDAYLIDEKYQDEIDKKILEED